MRTSELASAIFCSLLASAVLSGCETSTPVDADEVNMARGVGLRGEVPSSSPRMIRTGSYRPAEGAAPMSFRSLELLEGQMFRREASCAGEACSGKQFEGYYEETDTIGNDGARLHTISFFDGESGAMIDAYQARTYEFTSYAESKVPRPSLSGYTLLLERLGAKGGERTSLELVDAP